jgi:hypothetical protein
MVAATRAGIITYAAGRAPPACYCCGQHGHKADACALPRRVVQSETCSKEGHAATTCWQKMGKPEWANQMAQPGLRRVAELEAQLKELTGKLAAVQATFASMAGEPSREAKLQLLGCWIIELGGTWGVGRAALPVMGRVRSMLSSQPQCMFMQLV